MAKAYVAAPWIIRAYARSVRDALRNFGISVSSAWMDQSSAALLSDRQTCTHRSTQDFWEIDEADLVIVLTDYRQAGVGHHIETGYALAKKKLVVVVGPVKSVFHHLADFHYDTWEAAEKELKLWSGL